MRVELDEGQWAEIKEPGELRHADRKAVLKQNTFEIVPDEGKAIVNGANDEIMTDALLRRIITDWSLPFPLPRVDEDSLGKLTLDQADKLAEAVRPHMDLIMKKTDPAKKGTDPTEG